MFGWLFGKSSKDSASVESEKDVATRKKQPYFKVLNLEYNNDGVGAFELDWNVWFVMDLRKQGVPGNTEEEMVDNWFTGICRHVAMETYQEFQADPDKRVIERRPLGDGKAEYS